MYANVIEFANINIIYNFFGTLFSTIAPKDVNIYINTQISFFFFNSPIFALFAFSVRFPRCVYCCSRAVCIYSRSPYNIITPRAIKCKIMGLGVLKCELEAEKKKIYIRLVAGFKYFPNNHYPSPVIRHTLANFPLAPYDDRESKIKKKNPINHTHTYTLSRTHARV